MTITLPLQPQEKAQLPALVGVKGVCPVVIVRAPLEKLLRTEPERWTSAIGAALVAVMQASPYKDIDFESRQDRLPVKDVAY